MTLPLHIARAVGFVLLAGCGPGDGTSLDENGRSIAHPWQPPLGSRLGEVSFAPTFTGIETGFFARFCTECHAGSGAPRGLDLSGPAAYDDLVGVPSAQRAGVPLVDPGNPKHSYLIHKLEGAPGITGQRMPRNRPARPAGEIDLIAAWIQAGALRD